MNLQQALKTIPPEEWISDQVVVFDWYDGPRQGVARMTQPECEFVFELLAERHNPDGMDDRLFRINELPRGSVTQILEAIRVLGNPANEVWVPLWNFDSEQERQWADQEIGRILAQKKKTRLIISSRDMISFLGCWQLDQGTDQTSDWFAVLDIA